MLKCTCILKLDSLDFSWIMCVLLLQLVIPGLQNAGGLVCSWFLFVCLFLKKACSVVVLCGTPYTI